MRRSVRAIFASAILLSPVAAPAVTRADLSGATDVSAPTCTALFCAGVTQPADKAILTVRVGPALQCTAAVWYESHAEAAQLTPAGGRARATGVDGVLRWSWPEARYGAWGLDGTASVRCQAPGKRPTTGLIAFSLVPIQDAESAPMQGRTDPPPTPTPVDFMGQYGAAGGSGFSVSVSVAPNPLSFGAMATLTAVTTPDAVCTPQVVYSTGASPTSLVASSLTVPPSGVVTWTWHEETRGDRGTATVTCLLAGRTGEGATSFSVAP